VGTAAERVARPRDRRQRIIAAAGAQFRASGYHNVGITDIADAVGITSGALYRHFTSKRDLLFATVQDALAQFQASWAQERPDLEALLAVTCAVVLRHRDAVALVTREAAHLTAGEREDLHSMRLWPIEAIRPAIAAARPDLSSDGVDLLMRATLGAIASVGYHTIEPSARAEDRLVRACRSICLVTPAPVPAASIPLSPSSDAALLPVSTRECILTAATQLFSAHGYQDVSIGDVGAAARVTKATVYHHFANKSAILTAALNRCVEVMLFDLAGALESAPTPSEALATLLRRFVAGSILRGPVAGALLDQVVDLPSDERHAIRRAQAVLVTEWAAVLVKHRPELSDAEARLLVHAMTSSISFVLASPQLRRRPTLEADLVAIGRSVLGLGIAGLDRA
jgi:AcrR family transcriptional regulator